MKKIKRVLCTVLTTCLMLSSMAVPTMAETFDHTCYPGDEFTKTFDTNSGKIYLCMSVVKQSALIGNDGHWRAKATGDAKVATSVSFGMNGKEDNVLSTRDLSKVREVWVTKRSKSVKEAYAKLRW